ncbi:MAG: helix-turn-helix transcriptional regulator [Clostridiales bacterium]|jgi:transcriptional regulator with XRE-family HTH domain|nr:helix-turn-helix transcriptional regulator [Clostridiales bacterium]
MSVVSVMRIRRKPFGHKNNIGRKIIELRKQKGYSQKDLLTRIQLLGWNLDDAVLSKIEGQDRAIKYEEQKIIAKALNVDPDDLSSDPTAY